MSIIQKEKGIKLLHLIDGKNLKNTSWKQYEFTRGTLRKKFN